MRQESVYWFLERRISQGTLYHNSKVASGIRIFKGATGRLSISGTSFVSLNCLSDRAQIVAGPCYIVLSQLCFEQVNDIVKRLRIH